MAKTLILNRAEIEAVVSPAETLAPMRDAFRRHSIQRAVPALRIPSPLPPPAPSDASAMILVPVSSAAFQLTPSKCTRNIRAKIPAFRAS